MEKIKIVPTSRRAKDRVRQHGDEMELVKKGKFRGQLAIFVRSLGPTWSGNQHWQGWFTDDEIEM